MVFLKVNLAFTRLRQHPRRPVVPAVALLACTTHPHTNRLLTGRKSPMDPITTQLTIHQILDVIWPILPPHILEQLAYV